MPRISWRTVCIPPAAFMAVHPSTAERRAGSMKKWFWIVALLSAFLPACGRGRDAGPAALREAKAPAAAPAPATSQGRTRAEARELVKTVELDLRVADTTASAGELQTL